MSSAWDSLRELLWAELRKIEARRTTYRGKIVQASAADDDAPGGPRLARVWVSGIDPDKDVPVHPTLCLDDQIRALGDAAIGMDVVVESIGGQLSGLTIQLTGETRW